MGIVSMLERFLGTKSLIRRRLRCRAKLTGLMFSGPFGDDDWPQPHHEKYEKSPLSTTEVVMDTQSRTWKRKALLKSWRTSDRRSVKPDASRVDKLLSRIKIIMEIVAIPVVAVWAAYWAFTHFYAEDEPALEHRAKIEGNLSWQKRSDEECIAEFRIKFENVGKRSINLKKAMLKVWPLDIPVLSMPIVYVDPLEMVRDKEPIVKADLTPYLDTRYPPTVADYVGSMLLVKRAPGKMMFFW